MSDVRIYQSDDDGEIDVTNGIIVMDDGLESSVYLSLFGGTEQDSGDQATEHLQWWGNLSETDPARKYRSELQFLLQSIPAVPANLRRLEDAGNRDLAWMLDSIASSVAVTASIPALNQIKIAVEIFVSDKKYDFAFTNARHAQS